MYFRLVFICFYITIEELSYTICAARLCAKSPTYCKAIVDVRNVYNINAVCCVVVCETRVVPTTLRIANLRQR